MIISKLKETAEMYLGVPITHAVITVPAYFNDAQRQATKDAGGIAGLKVLRILNEPTAAAIAYGLDLNRADLGRKSRVLVFDLGGGTFDVLLLRIRENLFEVLAVSGDGRLGGQDLDNRVIDYLVSRYKHENRIDIANDSRAMSKLRREVEKAKRTLSSQLTARIEIESFEGGNDYSYRLTRAKFEELNMELLTKAINLVRQVLQDANIESSEVDEVVLVGGSTRIPKVRELLKELFAGRNPKMGINPDEAVAHGAAIEGAIISGERELRNLILVDVSPMTLGVELTGGVFSPLISRNTPLPFQKSEIFSTASNNQRVVTIRIFQGERALTKDNTLLGTFSLSGIRPAARGVPQIKVQFDLDNDGILKVSAYDMESGINQSMVITRDRQALTEKEIKRMTKEVEAFNKQDLVREQQSSARHTLQQSILEARARLSGPSALPDDTNFALDSLFDELDSTKILRDEDIRKLQARYYDIMAQAQNLRLGGDLSSVTLDSFPRTSIILDGDQFSGTPEAGSIGLGSHFTCESSALFIFQAPVSQLPKMPVYSSLWEVTKFQSRLLTCAAISPLGSHLVLGSEDRNMVFVDMNTGCVTSVVSFEGQFAIMAAVWYSETNLIVGGCNGILYYVCINPVSKKHALTMQPFLSPFPQRIRNIALDPEDSILAIGYGNTVALHVGHTIKGQVTWRPIELIQGPAHNRSGLVNSLTFFPTRCGLAQLLVSYAEAGWSVWNPCGTVRHINPAVHHNVCRVGRASLGLDGRMVLFSTLDRSVVTYPLNEDGPIMAGKKEYANGDRTSCSLVVPVEMTQDGYLLVGTALGEVSIIETREGADQGNSTVIRHADENHLIRVIVKFGSKVVIGSSSPDETLVRCYSTNAVTRPSSSKNNGSVPVHVSITEAVAGWQDWDLRWARRWNLYRMMRSVRVHISCSLFILVFVLSILFLMVLSVDPPNGTPFGEATKDSEITDLMKPRFQRHQYWILFGIQHFFKYIVYQYTSWLIWAIQSLYDFSAGVGDAIPGIFEIFGVVVGGWMCNQVSVYREAGVCPKVEY